MHYSLIFTVTIAVLVSYTSSFSIPHPFENLCEFLKYVEKDQHEALESLTQKAAVLGRAAIEILPKNSSFEEYIKRDLDSVNNTQGFDQMIDFLNRFESSYNRYILGNLSLESQPTLRLLYNNWDSESSNIIENSNSNISARFDEMRNKPSENWSIVKQEYSSASNVYMYRRDYDGHPFFGRYLYSDKSKYYCDE
ncbi:GL26023 [Drosophila persimilis]|uniref:GL26023 n=1 Tax=Drosophila persimilis TaxID=7234 RepID=B4GK76_DROPE|nr:GL26023 [Drosophila persimilis]